MSSPATALEENHGESPMTRSNDMIAALDIPSLLEPDTVLTDSDLLNSDTPDEIVQKHSVAKDTISISSLLQDSPDESLRAPVIQYLKPSDAPASLDFTLSGMPATDLSAWLTAQLSSSSMGKPLKDDTSDPISPSDIHNTPNGAREGLAYCDADPPSLTPPQLEEAVQFSDQDPTLYEYTKTPHYRFADNLYPSAAIKTPDDEITITTKSIPEPLRSKASRGNDRMARAREASKKWRNKQKHRMSELETQISFLESRIHHTQRELEASRREISSKEQLLLEMWAMLDC